jgi:hypothetical protein
VRPSAIPPALSIKVGRSVTPEHLVRLVAEWADDSVYIDKIVSLQDGERIVAGSDQSTRFFTESRWVQTVSVFMSTQLHRQQKGCGDSCRIVDL